MKFKILRFKKLRSTNDTARRIIRNSNLDLCNTKEAGLIQTLSLLPVSYPGQSILTEDIGVIHGIDNCKCGKLGKYFSVLGRVPDSELRGCSDVN